MAPAARPAQPATALPGPTHSASPSPDPPAAVPEPAQTPTLGISAASIQELDAFIAATGTRPEVFDVFEPWSADRPLDLDLADAVESRGARLSVTWEPWDPAGPRTDQPAYSLASIVGGAHDDYIDRYATSVRAHGRPLTIRLMHEMNGNWYPWGSGVNGNRDGDFVRAWQHVQGRFAALGVDNVEWLWAPNAVYPGGAPLGPLFPGDAAVDAVGISNYNWGARTHDGHSTAWTDFGSLFDESIAEVRALTARPLWVAEVGSSGSGGSKAGWITEMMAAVQQRPDITGLVWFDHIDVRADVDWRIETEPDAAAAWRAAARSRPQVADSMG
ncbi:glycosyl hydrolase [Modestobacter sp. VKM Ac-2977]|uniref:glycoside hydrolase family 26 protein n=1 Tax=Modestobacter sp. VKM Ac-2977 TaxID=3004131 RepID=UPI0022AA706F|nr:glycosyl hydrolase [Modestobacter sp. VKM Ac-2977]MCZ2819079.1 glycosyl hydrolase [Modestobacter sp. VKM Ac-2977]